MINENSLANKIIGISIKMHQTLGPGLLENVYKQCLYYNLLQEGLFVEKEKAIPLVYENVHLECGYRIDLLVEKKLVLEIKSVESLHDLHFAQTLTYLRLGNFKLALLINFNEILLKTGIRRIINSTVSE